MTHPSHHAAAYRSQSPVAGVILPNAERDYIERAKTAAIPM
jgi:hypothetical protein